MSDLVKTKRLTNTWRGLLTALFLSACSSPSIGQINTYNPLKISGPKCEMIELSVKDTDRSREVPLQIYLPAVMDKETVEPAPVIIHSHGLGGTNKTSAFLGKHWGARGYIAIFVQHPGSDDSVWKDVPRLRRFQAMRKAASAENLKLRIGDINAVIVHLENWNTEPDHPLNGRMDLDHIGMSGHSFGAITTQHVSGVTVGKTQRSTNAKIKAAIPMSPSTPRLQNAEKAFGNVSIPWLCMTGTHDESIIGGASAESRQLVYPALPPKDKYELVLFEAEHSVFTERALPNDTKKRNPNHHTAIKAISTAFWDAHLGEDPAAKNWLTTKGPQTIESVLEPKDRWQFK